MAVCYDTNTFDVITHGRTDPEYYLPEHTSIEKVLNKISTKTLGALGNLSCSAFYPAATHLYESGDMPFLRCVDIVDFPIISNAQPFAQIPYSFVQSHSSIQCLNHGDIVISKVGTPCYASLLHEDMPLSAMSRTVLGLTGIDETLINKYYLIAFLRSRYGFLQLQRERELTIQYQLTLDRTRKVRVYIPDMQTQKKIGETVQKYYLSIEKSKNLYTLAQKILEQEFGLDKLKFEKPIGYEANFCNVISSWRIDAQHYRGRYDILFDQIKKGAWKYLKDLCMYNRRGQQPLYVENGTIEVINSQHIGKQHLDYRNFQKTTLKFYESVSQAHVQFNDLLIYTTGAYIGNTNVYLSKKPALASNHVNILRLRDNVDAAYLAMIMQSVIGQLQTEKHSRGSAQAELYPNDIDKFIVPILPHEKQKKIGDLSRESLRLNQQSYELLAQAKQMVEDLIEQAAGNHER